MGMNLRIEKANRFFIQRSGLLFILITHGVTSLVIKIFYTVINVYYPFIFFNSWEGKSQ